MIQNNLKSQSELSIKMKTIFFDHQNFLNIKSYQAKFILINNKNLYKYLT